MPMDKSGAAYFKLATLPGRRTLARRFDVAVDGTKRGGARWGTDLKFRARCRVFNNLPAAPEGR